MNPVSVPARCLRCHGFMAPIPPPPAARKPAHERDVGARAPIERELDHLHRLASLGTVAALIAHEFNNLLTPILSYTQAALDQPNDAVLSQKAVAKAHHAANRASTIATAILDLARKSTGDGSAQITKVAESCGVLDCTSAALSCLARDLKNDGLGLVLDVPVGLRAGLPPVVLEQMLLNLILNARRAMLEEPVANGRTRRGSGTLTITGRDHDGLPPFSPDVVAASSTWNTRDEHGGRWVTIQVSDTGRGIAPERLLTLFDDYVRGTDSSERPVDSHSPGTGLGLALCKRLAIAHGCQILVQSQVSVGTSFTIIAPLTDASAQRRAA